MVESEDGLEETSRTEVEVRKCSDQDLDKFYPPFKGHANSINKVMKTAYCLNG
jgi:hypothetical protein